MHLYVRLSLCLLFLTASNWLLAQPCQSDEVAVTIGILTDAYPEELSWSLVGLDGTVYEDVKLNAGDYEDNELYEWELCLPEGACATFTIRDSYGDGLEPPGYFAITVDGTTIVQEGFLKDEATASVNCAAGFACATAFDIAIGEHAIPHDDAWYVFTPDLSGQYKITTCDLASCDTKIWVFTNCSQAHNDEDNDGTLAYGDNFGDCGEQADVTVGMEAGKAYYIRLGDDHDACMGVDWKWELSYAGPITGCTEMNACNFNPLATIDDGSCLPFGHPDCPEAPDLLVRQDVLVTSAYLSQIQTVDDCLVEEGCLQGYGIRDILRFSTRIDNIGEADYFIGSPSPDSDQFTFDNCHNHWHYDGYAEYILYNELGQVIPIGFKNGFCVLDLGCDFGTPQYSCDNMGIAAGCYDEYWAELECQWIDVTDVPDGRYTFVTRVNWDNAPDALGRRETDTLNNWAQMCIILDRSLGPLTFQVDEDCEPYVDCAGIPYGDTEIDCEGNCGGSTKYGDLNQDGLQAVDDVEAYLEGIVDYSLEPNTCRDLSADGLISVYDAALLSSCELFGESHPNPDTGPQNFCRFPRNVLNTNHYASVGIIDFDLSEQYFDLGIRITGTNLVGYQLVMSGLKITKVENLIDTTSYNMQPLTDGNGLIVGLSTEGDSIARSDTLLPFVRVYHDGNLDAEVCVARIIDLVSDRYERITGSFEDPCVTLTATTSIAGNLPLTISPNPFEEFTVLRFANPNLSPYELRLSDVNGRLLKVIPNILADQVLISANDLPKGVCFFQLSGEKGVATGKLLVQ